MGEGPAARPRPGRTAVRPPRRHRPHGQRPGRLPASHARRQSPDPVRHRNLRLGDVHPSAVRRVRSDREGRAAPAGEPAGGSATRCLRDRRERTRGGHGRIREDHRLPGNGAAVVVRLPAIAPDAGSTRRDHPGSQDVPREEAALRHDDLSRHRLLSERLEHAQRRVHLEQQGVPGPQKRDRAVAQRALQGRAAYRDRRSARGRRGGRSVHRAAASERPHARRRLARRSPGELLLAGAQAAPRSRRGWLVARPGRWPRRALAPGAQSDVFRGPPDVPAQRARLRAAPQWLRRHAAVRVVPVVGRRAIHLGDAEDARSDRREYRPERHPVLGHRYRRLCSHAGIHRRTVRALVPVRRLQSAVPLARARMEAAPAVGMDRRRDDRFSRDSRLQPRSARAAQRRPSSRSARSISSCATS